jgi:3-hydroxyacyl-[acyl-carrier-protein] dehydratase
MLLNDFFFLKDLQDTDGSVKASIGININHKIFEGHFPGQPVVPGVCMLQMMREILETVLVYKIQLRDADHLKFLAFIDPGKNSSIHIELQYTVQEDGSIRANASLLDTETVFFKFKGVFVKK